MFSSAVSVLLASAPLLSRPALFRPRYGSFPLLLLGICLLWVVLLRYALPGFRRRATLAALALVGLLLLSWLPRAAGRSWGARFLTPTYYRYVILPTTAIQVAILGSLLTAPIWVIWGRRARRRLERDESQSVATPSVETPPPTSPVAETALSVRANEDGAAASPAVPLIRPLSTRRLLARREVIAAAPWLLPAAALSTATYGALFESRRVVVRYLRVAIPGLPPSLTGFRIGQVTDIHIARDLTQLHHLERALSLLADQGLDILCATGDLCDEPKLYLTMLRMLAQVPTRLGHFGSIGNHELFMGLDVVRRAYDRAPVQLLEEESVRLGGLRLAAVGYPTRGRSPRLSLEDVPAQVDEALRERSATEETATVLLAHHPHTFTQLAGRKIALTLSGHTHGGQLGFGDGSAVEKLYPYARGLYRMNGEPDAASQLFVSSGLGHWLPCRVNCPPEAVVIELQPAPPRLS
jgi:predicted MPP superfamily phosphohydrolase